MIFLKNGKPGKNRRIMISQPMKGLTNETILKTRNDAVELLESYGFTVVDTYFKDYRPGEDSTIIHPSVAFMSKSIDAMARVDAVYFIDKWWNNGGCVIEHNIASEYGLELFYEEIIGEHKRLSLTRV